MWAAARTLQAVFGVTYEIYSEARQLFLGAISKIGSGVDFRVCRDCVRCYSELRGTRKPRFGARLDFLSRLAAAARSPSQRQRPNDLQELLGFSDRLGAAAMGDGVDWP